MGETVRGLKLKTNVSVKDWRGENVFIYMFHHRANGAKLLKSLLILNIESERETRNRRANRMVRQIFFDSGGEALSEHYGLCHPETLELCANKVLKLTRIKKLPNKVDIRGVLRDQ